MTKTALILGASGRFGTNMINALRDTGWTIRKFNRQTDDLHTAAKGVDIIVHGWNPTYDKWEAEVPLQTKQIISVARAVNATVLIPGNVYVYGEDGPNVWHETTPHAAKNILGKIRAEMEKSFQDSDVQTIQLRGGDFLDTTPSGNWFDRIMVKNLHKGKFVCPGDPTIERAWAYLPDYTRALAALADKRDELPKFATFNYAGYTLTGSEMAKILGAKPVKMNWLLIQLLQPFWKMARHFCEMRYLWNKPHRLDGSALRAALPDFKQTPPSEALHIAASFKINPNQPMIRSQAPV